MAKSPPPNSPKEDLLLQMVYETQSILWKFVSLTFNNNDYQVTILHISRQLSYRGMCLGPSQKSHNALDRYPTTHHFVTEMCTHVYVSVTKWFIVGYGTGALWDAGVKQFLAW